VSNTCLANEHRKARKPHRCCECKIRILPGETYWHYRGVSDGEIHSQNTCDDCEQLRNDVFASWDPWDAAYGMDFESLGEHCEDEPFLGRWLAIKDKAQQRKAELVAA
jgi:hypothetical protein